MRPFRRCAVLGAMLTLMAVAGEAHAGPDEVFVDVGLAPGKPDFVAARYFWAGSGLFLSQDRGANFNMICYSAINSSLTDSDVSFVGASGAIYLGAFGGLWTGNQNGCAWHEVADFHGKFVTAFARSAVDPNTTYLVTSTGGGALNSVFANSGKDAAWVARGTGSLLWLNTIQTVKTASGERIYETAVVPPDSSATNAAPSQVVIRMSDDGAMTFTDQMIGAADQFGPADPNANFYLWAIDPANADHVVGVVQRAYDDDTKPKSDSVDDLVYSAAHGMPGSWTVVAHVNTLQSAEFGPNGQLFFGDYDQDSPALFVVEKPGDVPKQLSHDWKVGCLKFDAANHRMYGCEQWLLGSVDMNTGAFTSIFDMRTADKFVDCPGEPPVVDRCKDQLLAGYCGLSHYPQAPLCAPYGILDITGPQSSAGASSGAAGATTTAGSGGASGGSSGAGAGGTAGSSGSVAGLPPVGGKKAVPPTTVVHSKNAGCGCSTLATSGRPGWDRGLWCLLPLGWMWQRRRAVAFVGPRRRLARASR